MQQLGIEEVAFLNCILQEQKSIPGGLQMPLCSITSPLQADMADPVRAAERFPHLSPPFTVIDQ